MVKNFFWKTTVQNQYAARKLEIGTGVIALREQVEA